MIVKYDFNPYLSSLLYYFLNLKNFPGRIGDIPVYTSWQGHLQVSNLEIKISGLNFILKSE